MCDLAHSEGSVKNHFIIVILLSGMKARADTKNLGWAAMFVQNVKANQQQQNTRFGIWLRMLNMKLTLEKRGWN